MKPETLRTRWSFLAGLDDPEDQHSWAEFCRLYTPLILDVARKAGLGPQEAEDAVQDTMKGIHADIRRLAPSLKPGTFRAWLRNRARWHTINQIRKRLPVGPGESGPPSTSVSTSTTDRIPDPQVGDPAKLCDQPLEEMRLAEAVSQLRTAVNSRDFQVFHLLIHEERSIAEVARLMGRTQAGIRLIKFRVSRKFKQIYARLVKEDGQFATPTS